MTTPTLVSPPAKIQKLPFALQPCKTLTTTSTLLMSKNVKYPVSPPARATACPEPLWPAAVVHRVVTLKRPPLRQRVVESETQDSMAVVVYSYTPPPVPA